MMQEEDDVADTIYQSSPTLPGKRFAAEFIEKRNADVASGSSNAALAKGNTGNTSSGGEATRLSLHPGQSQDSLGYKVVKKKKGGKV
jgi:PERQ amino acid-rich with GYF domain-containing protein